MKAVEICIFNAEWELRAEMGILSRTYDYSLFNKTKVQNEIVMKSRAENQLEIRIKYCMSWDGLCNFYLHHKKVDVRIFLLWPMCSWGMAPIGTHHFPGAGNEIPGVTDQTPPMVPATHADLSLTHSFNCSACASSFSSPQHLFHWN